MIVGLDANIICYALDENYPENEKLGNLFLDLSFENRIALNPTTLHEAYHVLVYSQKWFPEDAAKELKLLLKHEYIQFFNQTRKNCIIALSLSVKYKIGGRDALIIANFLANKIPMMYTLDKELLKMQKVNYSPLTGRASPN